MKRLLAILLVAALALSLTACGGNASVEDTVSTAITDVTLKQIQEDMTNNSARAKEEYVGQTFLLTGYAYDITKKGCKVSSGYWSEYPKANIQLSMPKADLVQLDNYGRIEFVGTLSETLTGGLVMKDARLVDTVTVIETKVATLNQTGEPALFDAEYSLDNGALIYIDSYATPEDKEKLTHSYKKIRGKIRLDTESNYTRKSRIIENAEYVSDEDAEK